MNWFLLVFLAQAGVSPQVDRGEALFADSSRGCVSCHALKGKGTAVGPDLKDISRLSPKAIAMGVRSTVTQYVEVVKLKNGQSFPAIVPKDASAQVFDLSKMPPEPKGTKADVASTSSNTGWKHPPSQRKYTNEEMADLISYIRYAGANNRQAVSPDDVQ